MRAAVVLVLVCLVSSAFATCNNGAGLSADNSGCVCMSGYSGASCNSADLAATCTSKTLVQTEATWFPTLTPDNGVPTTSPIRFVGNTLYAQIQGNYVADRTYTELTFVPSAAQKAAAVAAGTTAAVDVRCHVGNAASFWLQSTDNTVGSATKCNDLFNLVMPWSQHVGCGFANNTAKSDSEWMYITGYLFIRYSDYLGEVDGFNLTRSTKVPYAVSVKFQRHVTVQLVALNVTSDVKYGMALTEDTYNPETGELTLEITSIVNWPNKFYNGQALPLYKPTQVLPEYLSSTSQSTPSRNVIVCSSSACPDGGNPATVWAYDETCDQYTEKSLCTQKFVIIAMLDQLSSNNCTYDGRYDIIAPLYTCRDQTSVGVPPDCTNANINITFYIQDSWVCGQIGVAPTVTGHLYAFDPMYTSGFQALLGQTPAKTTTNFQLGKYGHFYAGLTQDNTLSVEFRDISFTVQGQSNWVQLFNSSGWRAPVAGDATYAETYPAQPAVVLGFVHPDSKYFRVYFHSSIFKVQPNSQVIYTFRATLDLSFQGNDHFINPSENRKRTIETTWEHSVTNAETNVFMKGESTKQTPAAAVAADNGVSSVTFIASVVGAVAGTMIIVFVVVGFALRARSASKDEPSSSLIAASAAAAEVANRA